MSKLSRSARAGVIFPVGRLMRYLKKGTFKYRISVGAPVYMAAVIEYLAGKVHPRGRTPLPAPSLPLAPLAQAGRDALIHPVAVSGLLWAITGFRLACLTKISFCRL